MYVFAYRNTERGIQERNAGVIAEKRATRLEAQCAAWQDEIAEQEAAIERRRRALERKRAMFAELHAQGITYRPTYHDLEARTLALFKLSRSELRSNRRHRELVFARQFLMYWAVRLTGLSLPQIGRLMGGFDHTTVLHGRRCYPERRAKMGRYLRPAR